jgi:CDP-glucose 4,6-dehydratase
MHQYNFWQNKKVLITGHTGFKGSWLSFWLIKMGANVLGFSLPPDSEPSLFVQLKLQTDLEHHLGDIRDIHAITKVFTTFKPDIVFHLAAQPLVRESFRLPVDTWQTNVLGTINVLEMLKSSEQQCAAVFITTDKCYENREWEYGYRENDPLGGYDPYSSSKAGAEIAIASWRRSFFQASPVMIASARAGNVIGGGDWAKDRIVPDAMRSLQKGQPIPVRNPQATRPWQHVLEPLWGYMILAEKLYSSKGNPNLFTTSFNFGPNLSSNQKVSTLVKEILRHWDGQWIDCSDPSSPHEAGKLNLVIDKSFHILDWQPVWDFKTTVKNLVNWYRSSTELNSSELRDLTLSQIKNYEQDQQQLTPKY